MYQLIQNLYRKTTGIVAHATSFVVPWKPSDEFTALYRQRQTAYDGIVARTLALLHDIELHGNEDRAASQVHDCLEHMLCADSARPVGCKIKIHSGVRSDAGAPKGLVPEYWTLFLSSIGGARKNVVTGSVPAAYCKRNNGQSYLVLTPATQRKYLEFLEHYQQTAMTHYKGRINLVDVDQLMIPAPRIGKGYLETLQRYEMLMHQLKTSPLVMSRQSKNRSRSSDERKAACIVNATQKTLTSSHPTK